MELGPSLVFARGLHYPAALLFMLYNVDSPVLCFSSLLGESKLKETSRVCGEELSAEGDSSEGYTDSQRRWAGPLHSGGHNPTDCETGS